MDDPAGRSTIFVYAAIRSRAAKNICHFVLPSSRDFWFARTMKMIASRYMKHLVAMSLVLAFPLSSLVEGQEQTEWVLTQGGVVVPVARICSVEHSTGQSLPTGWATGWRIMTMTSWVGGFAFFVDDAAARQFLQSHKRFVLGHWNKSTLDDYVSIDAAEFVKFDSKVDGKTIPATLLMRDNTGRKLLILEVTDPAEVKKVHDLTGH